MRLGKDKEVISLIFFLLLFTIHTSGQTGKKFKYQLDGNLPPTNVISTGQSIIINYSAPEINIESFSNSNGTFYRLTVPGHVPTTDPGKPELPVYSRIISYPKGSSFKIRITDIKSSRLKPSGKRITGILYPAQESETKLQQDNRIFRMDRTLYSSKGVIISDTVKIEPLGKVRNINLANLIISPVRYNPRLNSLEIISSMKIEVYFENAGQVTTKSLSASQLFNESLSKGVLNFNPGDVIPGYTTSPVKMIILTDTVFKKQLLPFFKWKMQKGFNVKVLYKGTGMATYSQFKDTLTNIYRSSTDDDPPPEYLLIIGDVNHIPYYGTTGNVTDMYYGEFDGNGDYMPDMFVGRLPVADTAELKTAVNKIIQYEKFQFADTNKFYNGAIATAGDDAAHTNYMNGQVKYAVTNYLTKSNNINESHFYNPQSLSAKDSIIELLNNGVSFINYTGHGDESGWINLNIKTADIPSFTNSNMYPFIISNACRTAEYYTPVSFGNKMVLTRNKGAIGFIGCSNDSYWDEDFYWAVGPGTISADPLYSPTGLGAYDRLFHTHNESPSDWYFSLGQVNYAGNLAVSATTSSLKKYYWETYNVIGDPSVVPIIGKPGTFSVSLPDTLPNGIKLFSLNIEPFAYAAVSHFDTLWDASYSSASGTLDLKMPGISNDSCLIVITGQNRIPIIKTIHIGNINREFLNLSASGINDIDGNNNGNADFGEHCYLKLTISNLGLTDANNLYAKISTASPWITINNDSAYIGTLTKTSDIILTDKLGITVAGNVPDREIATINLILKDQKSEKHYTIDITLHSPDLKIINYNMDDTGTGNGDHVADPGETFSLIFKVLNEGTSDVSGLFSLVSPPIGLSIIDQNVKSGILKFGELIDIPVKVKLSPIVSSGSYITVTSTLDCQPFIVNKDFTFRVGKVRESFEAQTFNVFPWINTSSIPWKITSSNSFDGIVSAQSGAISHNGSTTLALKTFYEEADSLKFYYKVSSEPNYDFLSFKLNDVEVIRKSGEIPWTRLSIPVPAGLNKMEWTYKKDQSVTSGADCAWIDMIDFVSTGSVHYIAKDLQLVKISAPVQKDRYGLETLTVKVVNTGRDVLNGFNLAYDVNMSGRPVTEFFENTLVPNTDTVTVSFKNKIDLSKYGIYNIVAYGINNSDDYPYNDTLSINVENKGITENLVIFPNPFMDHFTVYINSQVNDHVRISIINDTGITLNTYEKDILAGSNPILISDLKLLPGVYYLNIRGVTINKTVHILKVKK